MDDRLRANAIEILGRLPLSLEMPAGTGKTQLVAALAAVAEEQAARTLVLTHTHAGVDAIRKRLKQFGVSARNVHIDTITGWAFDLVRSYPIIAGIQVPQNPDWSRSADYVAGAVRVAHSNAINEVHSASFDFFIIDEYQDCGEGQHELILAIATAIPNTCALGDRLQGIFDFRGQALVDWDTHVIAHFPPHSIGHEAWRWRGHNQMLGEWLLAVRPILMGGHALDLSTVAIPGLFWNTPDQTLLLSTAFQSRPDGESVLVLGQWPADVNQLARNLNGLYGVMEDLQGNFMVDFLAKIDAAAPRAYARHLADFSKECFSGLGGLDRAILDKLSSGQSVRHLKRLGLEPILAAFDALQAQPTLTQLVQTMSTIREVPSLKLFKREAWFDVLKSIETVAANGDVDCVDALGRIRDALRHSGRKPSGRIVSRTVLVKGLEYDHVIIANANALKNNRNLYVALTRARKTLTIFSSTPQIRF